MIAIAIPMIVAVFCAVLAAVRRDDPAREAQDLRWAILLMLAAILTAMLEGR